MTGRQAVILAGGLGVRLQPLTLTLPKPMAPVAGHPFLQHLLVMLRRRGMTRMLLLTGYLGDRIESHFGTGASIGVELSYSREPQPLGTGGALCHAAPALDDRFLLVNGDTYLDCDYASLDDALDATPALAAVAAYDNAIPVAPNNLLLTADGRVGVYSKHDPSAMTHVDAGAYALRRQALDRLPTGASSLEHDLFPALARDGAMVAVPVAERFYDIGTLQQLADAERFLA